jgi:hypothetical protein
VSVGTAYLVTKGPRACLPTALAYLALGLVNLALVALPPPAARARWRSAAAAGLRIAYMLPALALADTCRIGPGSVADAAAGAARGACGAAPWKGVLKLLLYDGGAVFGLWWVPALRGRRSRLRPGG